MRRGWCWGGRWGGGRGGRKEGGFKVGAWWGVFVMLFLDWENIWVGVCLGCISISFGSDFCFLFNSTFCIYFTLESIIKFLLLYILSHSNPPSLSKS